jgi:hypothetical protein
MTTTPRHIDLAIYRRPRSAESIALVHGQLMATLEGLPEPWAVETASQVPVPPSKSLANVLTLTKKMGKGIRAARVVYTLRGNESYTDVDEASRDDMFLLDLAWDRININLLSGTVLPALIAGFTAYCARLTIPEIAAHESSLRQALFRATGRDIGGRDTVFRILQINYWDRELCRRAWSLTPEEVVARLTGIVERASVLHDGAYVVVSTAYLSIPAVEEIDARLRPLLTSEPRIPLGLASLTA